MNAHNEDVVALLTRQHRQVEQLLETLVDADDAGRRAELLARAGDDLAVHIAAEETVLYPAVHAARTEDILLESLEEHLSLKRLLADLVSMPADDSKAYGAKCKVLQEQTEHHHKEEEEHLFPKLRLLLDQQRLVELGRAVREHEDRLRAAGDPRVAVQQQTAAAQPLP